MTRALLAVAVAVAALPSAARAAGAPLPSAASGNAGVVAPGGTQRLLTHRAGRDTRVVAVRRSDRGAVLRSRTIRGRWSVPAVTLAGATTGLSADGRTLVLARGTRRYPPASTRFAVLDARRLVVRREIVLHGFLTADAISPDGRRLYVIQYRGENPLDYRVRALDLTTGRPEPGEIVDPRQPDEKMAGLPMTRAQSRDGRWAYTLYGGGGETFIHALDTVGRSAACIELDMLPTQADLSGVRLRLSGDGRRIDVADGREHVTTVDTRTFAVGDPPPAAAARPSAPAADDSGGGIPWLLIGLGAAAAAAGLYAIRAARYEPGPWSWSRSGRWSRR